MAVTPDPVIPRRDQLRTLMPNAPSEMIFQFERLFAQAGTLLPSDVAAIYILLQENSIDANTGISKANSALSSIARLLDRELRLVDISTSYIAEIGNYSIQADATLGSIIVTLPDADFAKGLTYGVTKKDTSVNTVTIQGTGGQTIVGAASFVLIADGEVLNLISDGSNWELLN